MAPKATAIELAIKTATETRSPIAPNPKKEENAETATCYKFDLTFL